MQIKKLILIGGGGHCKVCIDIIERAGEFSIEGIIDTADKLGNTLLGYKFIGVDSDLERLATAGYYFLITIGQIKHAYLRKSIFARLQSMNARIATVISPSAEVSKFAEIKAGTIIMNKAVVNSMALIGYNCIINTGSNIEHDCIIGNHVHVSTGAIVNGSCHIGDEVFIGSNAVLVNNISISNEVVIGAGSVLNKSVQTPGTYVGNPFRKI